jgi:signal peptidase II
VIDLIASAAAFLFLDQWSKRLIQLRTADGWLPSSVVVRIRCVANTKTHYSRNSVRVFLMLAWLAAGASASTLHVFGAAFQSRASMIGVGAALGGAAGNLLDILRSRSVTDFIDLGWWPVFNIADVAIVAGLAVAFLPA